VLLLGNLGRIVEVTRSEAIDKKNKGASYWQKIIQEQAI
jgi:hypothetical protein